MVRPWVGWLCILLFISLVFYLYLSINAPIIRNPYIVTKHYVASRDKSIYKSFYHNHSLHSTGPTAQSIKVNNCSTIHVAIVCAGHNSVSALVTTVKSILFYRTKVLHLHLLVDNIALQSLNTLFKTWNLPQVTVSFHMVEKFIPKVSWIPNKHYSGVYGLLKLILPDAINENKVLVLDTDVTVLNDISLLWELFRNFNDNQVLGLVENQSNWYIKSLSYNSHPWPALGRGFNSGVILMDLKRMRANRFSQLWKSTASTVLKEISETSLADQDIINAVIKSNPEFVYTIDCTWNVQLSDHALSENCYNNVNQLNIIHWNSPRKQNVRNKHAQDFRKMHKVFLELDGNLLRRRLFSCHTTEKKSQINDMDPCYKFQEGANIVYRTHIFLLEYEYNVVNPYDIFLATQCSFDRISLLEDLSDHWPGVISVALYLTDAEVQSFLDFVQNSEKLSDRKNIAYHVVYKEGDLYPVNYLRNVAMNYINLPFIFQLDIDFLPQYGLYLTLINHVIQENLTHSQYIALVVPAFETQRYRFTFPTSKTELLKYLSYGILYTFRYHVWARGHAPTNYDLYKNSTKPYEVAWEPDYEPFIVVSKSAPVYDTRFLGFGWNKVSYITHLTALGYKYIVLPDTFIIHRPHAPSRDIGKFRTDASYRRCLKSIKDMFIDNILRHLGNTALMNLKKMFNKDIKNAQNISNL